MSSRTLLIANEEALATSAGSASSITSATVVRLFNASGGIATVSMTSTVGAADTVSFSLPNNQVEFLQKPASYVIWGTSTSIKANKVGFTN